MEELQIITPSFITAAQEVAMTKDQEHDNYVANEQLNLLSHDWATKVIKYTPYFILYNFFILLMTLGKCTNERSG